MSEIYAKEFEDYIITGNEDCLKTLIPGSVEHRYAMLCRKIIKEEYNESLLEELKKFDEDFCLQGKNYRLQCLALQKMYEKNPNDKEKIVKIIMEIFGISNVTPYTKPIKYNTENLNNDEIHYPSKLDESKIVKFDNILNDIYAGKIDPTNTYIRGTFSDIFFDIDFIKIPLPLMLKAFLDDNYSIFYDIMKRNFLFTPIDPFKKGFANILPQIFKNQKDTDKALSKLRSSVNCLTNDQMEFILTFRNDKNINLDFFLYELIKRKYVERPEKTEEQKKILVEINGLLDKMKFKFQFFKRELLLSLLNVDATLNHYDLKLFLEYLECPVSNSTDMYKITDDMKKQIQANASCRTFVSSNIDYIASDAEKKLITKYLFHFFFFDNLSIDKFTNYFNLDFLNKIYYKAKVLKGSEEKIGDQLTSGELSELIKQVKLEICDFNKKKFEVNESIELILNVKNISTLFIKIYEINTENYYYTNKKPLDPSITVEGIIPTYEDVYTYSDKPQVLCRKKIVLEKIPKKRGMYVVEFIGNGHSSRAIIKKGGLTLIYRNTHDGQVFFILDEEKNICKGEDTGIWMKGQWFPAIETGAILIPYQKAASNEFLIYKHDNFCDYQNVEIKTESYTLDGMWIIKEESMIMGNVCKCLVRPYLYVDNQLTDIKNLSNPKIVVDLVKSENNQDIPITLSFDNINLSNNEEYEFEFQIPPRLKNINLTLSGEVKYKSRPDKLPLSISQYYIIKQCEESQKMIKIINGEYIVELLGKNGEPHKHMQVMVNLKHKCIESGRFSNLFLETDNEGKVNLGTLKDFVSVTVNETTFEINKQDISYYSEMTVIKGDELKLPIMGESKVNLFKLINNIPVENLTHKLRIEYSDIDKKHGFIMVNDLEKGLYRLNIEKESILIEVVEGKKWDKADFIITKDKIQEGYSSKEPVSLQSFEYKDKTLRLKINRPTTNCPRVHITAYQYYDKYPGRELINQYKKLKNYHINSRKSIGFPIQSWKNYYLNDKILHEEIKYVLDRKQYERTLGNSLEKPSLLVKPQFIQDTNTKINEAKEGTGFSNDMQPMMAKCCGDYSSKADREMPRGELNAFTTYNFISKTPLIISNLKPTEKGEIAIGCDLTGYSTVQVVCVDEQSMFEEIISLDNPNTDKNDLRMKTNLNSEKDYCELRKIHHLSKGQNYFIQDMTSVKYQIFDSVEKFATYLKLMVTPQILEQYNKFEFLLSFDKLTLNEKFDKLSEYFSHEFNIYLYFHHNDFFNEYVYPLIKYKTEKTFIDYFLINDAETIQLFTAPGKIAELNTFEQCLLIYSLRKTNPALAKSIAKTIALENEFLEENPEENKRRFNTALNIKLADEKERTEQLEEMTKECAKIKVAEAESKCSFGQLKSKKMVANCRMGGKMHGGLRTNALFAIPQPQSRVDNIANTLFQETGKSKEYCETHYYNSVYSRNSPKNFVKANSFYADLANFWANNTECLRNTGFHTDNFLIRPDNFTQMIFALSVIDLEPKTVPHAQDFVKDNGLGLTINANINSYILTKEISETKFKDTNKNDLIIAQMTSLYSKNASKEEEDKEPTKYLINTPYLQKTIITNISNKQLLCELLMQIPEGAVPLYSDEYTIIQTSTLNKFQSLIFSQKFYFPLPGKFIQYPSSASINDFVVSKSQPKVFEVLSSPSLSKDEQKTLDDVMEQGDKKEILEFIKKTEVIKSQDLKKIYWLLSNKEFYQSLVQILREKLFFDSEVWRFGFYHHDLVTIKEYLEYQYPKDLLSQIGPEFDSFFIKIDKTNNAHLNNHKDYYPIMNNRAHKLPKAENTILTVEFRRTYRNYISYLMTLKELNDVNYLRLCYYLILQQRIDEALKVYEKIKMKTDNEKSSLMLQYDYITAYLDFSTGYPKFTKAREICKKYKDFPLSTWNDMFNEISDQLKEFDGVEKFDNLDEVIEKEQAKEGGSTKANELKAKKEEYINLSIKDKKITVLYKNIKSLEAKFYLIDVEILFSRSPFMKKKTNDFSYVIPNMKKTYEVEEKNSESKLEIDIPEEYVNKNVYIEVSSNKIKEFETYYSSLLQCSFSESIGEVKVLSPDLKPLPKVYVKCFCKNSSDYVQFYKDGYTDLRGRFNYVTLNSDLINQVEKFSILIISEEYGSIIKECKPPKVITDKSNNNHVGGYESFQNYRQQVKNQFRAYKK